MLARDIPRLSVLVLKEIAKSPAQYLTLDSYKRAINIVQQNVDFTQILIDYITEAGRLNDDVIPIEFFTSDRITLILRNTKLSSKYINKVIDKCPLLKEIDLSGTFQVDDELVIGIVQKCPSVKYLNIRNCRKISDKVLNYLSRNSSNIVSINLGGDINITLEGIKQYLQSNSSSKLTELHLSGLMITEETITLLSKKCLNLTKIGINYACINESCLRNFLDSELGRNLTLLHIAWISTTGFTSQISAQPEQTQISSEFFTEFLPYKCPVLEELDASGIKNVNSSTLQQYLENRWRLVDQGVSNKTLGILKLKFAGSSKAILEQYFSQYNHIKVEL